MYASYLSPSRDWCPTLSTSVNSIDSLFYVFMCTTRGKYTKDKRMRMLVHVRQSITINRNAFTNFFVLVFPMLPRQSLMRDNNDHGRFRCSVVARLRHKRQCVSLSFDMHAVCLHFETMEHPMDAIVCK